ncbi:MAG: hypothetical protein GY854_03065 [Deltaproteobacteria bacterium]|nr:hypothetical protein [Deltaproteobacteria bacterium]
MKTTEFEWIWDLGVAAFAGIAFRALLFAFLGLVLGIIAVVLLRKFKLLKRENRYWNIAAKLIYIYALVLFPIFGGMFGVVKGGQSVANDNIEKLAEESRAMMPKFKTYLEINWDQIEGQDRNIHAFMGQFLAHLYYKPRSDSFFEKKKARVINYATLNMGKWVIVAGLTAVLVKSGELAGLDDDTIDLAVKLIKEADMSDIDKTIVNIITDAVTKVANDWFFSIYTSLFLTFLLFLSIPALEIGIYFFLERRKAKRIGQGPPTLQAD